MRLRGEPAGSAHDRYLASLSWIAALADDRRADTLAQVDTLVSSGQTPAELPVHVILGLTARV